MSATLLREVSSRNSTIDFEVTLENQREVYEFFDKLLEMTKSGPIKVVVKGKSVAPTAPVEIK